MAVIITQGPQSLVTPALTTKHGYQPTSKSSQSVSARASWLGQEAFVSLAIKHPKKLDC